MITYNIRLRELFFVVLVLWLGIFTLQHPGVLAQGITLETVCRWGEFTRGRLFSWSDWSHVEFTDADTLAAIRDLDVSDTAWQTSGSYGYFNPPADHMLAWTLTMTVVGSAAHHIDIFSSASQPEYVWVFAFQSEQRSARPDGSAYGLHGCSRHAPGGAFRMTAAAWQELMAEMEQG